MANGDGFGDHVEFLVDAMLGYVEDVKREATLELVRYLYRLTPKDTTNASKSWTLSVGAPVYTIFDGAAVKRNPVQEAYRQLIRNPVGSTIYITNSERYIEFLEGGGSSQAPAGFMRQAVAAWPGFVKNTDARYKKMGWG